MTTQDFFLGLAFAAMVSTQWAFFTLAGATPAML